MPTSRTVRELGAEELRKLLGEGPAVVYTAEPTGDFRATYISPNVAAQIGYEPEEFLSDPKFWIRHIHPEDLARVLDGLHVLLNHDRHVLEYRFRHKNGDYRWMYDEVKLIRDSDSKPRQIIGYWVDITDRKQTEDLLRFQAQLLDSVRESVVATDLEGNVIYWGKGAGALYDYRAEEVMGKPVTFIVQPDEVEEEEERMRAVWATGSWSGQYIQKRKDGSKFWADTVISLVKDGNGRPCGLVGIDRDITKRKAAEEALRESEERFRVTFEQAAVGMARLAPDGRYLNVNQKLCQITGYSAQQMLERRCTDITHPEDLEADLEQKAKVLAGEIDAYSMKKRYCRSDGSIVWVDRSISLVRDPAGQPKYFISVIEDITERRKAEAALQKAHAELERRVAERTAELKKANDDLIREVSERQRAEEIAVDRQIQLSHVARVSTMGEMAAALAHELNQPLSAIKGYAQACQRLLNLEDGGADELSGTMAKIAAQAQRAGEIIRQVRTFVAKEPGKRTKSDIKGVVQEAISLVAAEAANEGVLVRAQLEDDLPPLNIDRIQVEQAIVNVLRNGIEAIAANKAEKREITVRALLNGKDAIEVAISDTGPGISAHVAESLFHPFVSTKPQGLGMGLSICRTIISAHEGRLWATGNQDGGATFHLTLPVATSAQNHGT